jgi:hypothetical protein
MKCLQAGFFLCICLFVVSTVFSIDNSFKLDFDGDGRTDIALYREGSRDPLLAPQPSYWYFLNTATGQTGAVHWGRTLDVPAPSDYDGDGITDVGIHRWWSFDVGDANEYWFYRSSGGYDVLVYEWDPGYDKFNRNYIGDARAEVGQLYKVNTSPNPSVPCYISVYFIGDVYDFTIRKPISDTCNVIPTPIPGDYDNDGRFQGLVRALRPGLHDAANHRDARCQFSRAGRLRRRRQNRLCRNQNPAGKIALGHQKERHRRDLVCQLRFSER